MVAAYLFVSNADREPLVPVGKPRRNDVRRNADIGTAREDCGAFEAEPPRMTDGDSFDRVLASLWEAALDNTLWPAASAAIDEACATKGNNLAVVCPDGEGGFEMLFEAVYHHREHRPDLQRDYKENYFAKDERVPRFLRMPDMRPFPMQALYSEDERMTLPPYNEAMPRYVAVDGLKARMDGPEGSHICWIPFDPVRPRGWESDRLATVDGLLPHIRRFVGVRHALADAGALRETGGGRRTTPGSAACWRAPCQETAPRSPAR